MRQKRRKLSRGRLAAVLLCIVLVCAVLLSGAVLLAKVTHYGETSRVNTEPEPAEPVIEEPQPSEEEPSENGLIPGLDVNAYDPEKFYEKDGFTRYLGKACHVGVDVSSHQQTIDWQAVANAGVEFAMIRVAYRGYTEGEIQLDPYFPQNLQGAKDAGLSVGVYFFSQAVNADEALEEAQFVLDALDGAQLDYPVVYDWEDIEAEARTDGMDSTVLTGCASAFCSAIEQAGYRAGIYFNQRFGYEELELVSLQDYIFWLAEYNPTPTFLYDFEIWQYANDGRVDGISTDVDLNLSFFEP